jgi:hypothetical protein
VQCTGKQKPQGELHLRPILIYSGNDLNRYCECLAGGAPNGLWMDTVMAVINYRASFLELDVIIVVIRSG